MPQSHGYSTSLTQDSSSGQRPTPFGIDELDVAMGAHTLGDGMVKLQLKAPLGIYESCLHTDSANRAVQAPVLIREPKEHVTDAGLFQKGIHAHGRIDGTQGDSELLDPGLSGLHFFLVSADIWHRLQETKKPTELLCTRKSKIYCSTYLLAHRQLKYFLRSSKCSGRSTPALSTQVPLSSPM